MTIIVQAVLSDPDSHDESCSVCDCMCAADVNHYKENECMRLAMEDVLYNNGVDIVLNGHCHEYERSNPVYVSSLVLKKEVCLRQMHYSSAHHPNLRCASSKSLFACFKSDMLSKCCFPATSAV